MVVRDGTRLLVVGFLVLTTSVTAGSLEDRSPVPSPAEHSQIRLPNAEAPVGMFAVDGRMMRLYGQALSHGATPVESVEQFLAANAEFLGVTHDDLRERDVRGVMYEPDTDTYNFTRVMYAQYVSDVPVFRGMIKLLVRNDPGFPLVLAATDIRQVREGDIEVAPAGNPQAGKGVVAAGKMFPGLTFTDPEPVVWAGVDADVVQPAMATTFIGESPDINAPDYQKWLFIADARTGAILYTEDQVHNVDVEGSVNALVTHGVGADICEDEAPGPLPYARVNIGDEVAFADVGGNFVIPNGGNSDVTVESRVWGRYFKVTNSGGENALLSMDVTPPGPLHFLHNPANDDDFPRAEVNAYLHANIVRDFALVQNPTYPVIADQTEFTVRVNRVGSCNAFYSNGNSINFYRAGGGCPNMAFSSVVYHEYGHHIVESGGSGQGAYGEGMSDTTSVLIQDIPQVSVGFFGDCDESLRTADNDLQYPCNGPIHSCGRLLSGCVWSTRQQLVVTEPDDYREILSRIAINAVMMHTGASITPAITIDYLTLDDDDEDIFNGTPHYPEIAAGFGEHNMDAPALEALRFEYPDGRPELIDPEGSSTARVNVFSILQDPVPGTGILHVDDGHGIVQIPLKELQANEYEIRFPATDCPTHVSYYITAEADNGHVQHSPPDAPDERFVAVAATGTDLAFDDDFETDQGWSVTATGDVTAGAWERGVPAGEDSGPDEDADGSGQCYVTGLAPGEDIDGGGYSNLISPVMDASHPDAVLVFDRWMDNGSGTDSMIVSVSDDGGDSFEALRAYRPNGEEGVWVRNELRVDELPVDNTDEFVIQFSIADRGPDHTVEAAIDGVKMRNSYTCDADCEGDVDGDNDVEFDDLHAILVAFGEPCDDCPEDLDDDDDVDFDDLLIVLANFGSSCSD